MRPVWPLVIPSVNLDPHPQVLHHGPLLLVGQVDRLYGLSTPRAHTLSTGLVFLKQERNTIGDAAHNVLRSSGCLQGLQLLEHVLTPLARLLDLRDVFLDLAVYLVVGLAV